MGGPFLCSATAIPPSLPLKALGCRAEQLSRTAAFRGRRRLVLESREHGGNLAAARVVALSQQSLASMSSRRRVLRSALS